MADGGAGSRVAADERFRRLQDDPRFARVRAPGSGQPQEGLDAEEDPRFRRDKRFATKAPAVDSRGKRVAPSPAAPREDELAEDEERELVSDFARQVACCAGSSRRSQAAVRVLRARRGRHHRRRRRPQPRPARTRTLRRRLHRACCRVSLTHVAARTRRIA